jgi:hypothetical protein
MVEGGPAINATGKGHSATNQQSRRLAVVLGSFFALDLGLLQVNLGRVRDVIVRCPGWKSLTRLLGRRPLVLSAALFLLFVCTNNVSAGYISSDSLAPYTESGLLDSASVSLDQAGACWTGPDPTSPDGPTPLGILGVFSRTPVCPFRAPSGRSPRYSSAGADGGLCRTATVPPEPQLIIPFRAASAVTALTGPADSIFKPPRISG